MAGTLVQADFIYQSVVSGETYQYTVSYTSSGITVRDVENGYGIIVDPYSRIPASVIADISASITQVGNYMSGSTINGTLSFAAETSKSVVFTTSMTGTTYRVQLTTDTFIPLRVISKTLVGFTVEAAAAFTGTVGYDVFA